MKTLTIDQLNRYVKNPIQMDEQVREWCNLPDDKYYSVSIWPEHLSGRVWLTNKLVRHVKAKKISKSDQK